MYGWLKKHQENWENSTAAWNAIGNVKSEYQTEKHFEIEDSCMWKAKRTKSATCKAIGVAIGISLVFDHVKITRIHIYTFQMTLIRSRKHIQYIHIHIYKCECLCIAAQIKYEWPVHKSSELYSNGLKYLFGAFLLMLMLFLLWFWWCCIYVRRVFRWFLFSFGLQPLWCTDSELYARLKCEWVDAIVPGYQPIQPVS